MIHAVIRYTLCALCLIAIFPYAGFAAQDGEVGRVLSLKPGVNAERSGRRIALEQKSPVNGADVLHTDATGRAQILFADDSSVSLGSNTALALEDVVAEGRNPVFRARLGQGMARFITGKIVEQNPDGFAVVTPEATVGIRGTIFAVSSNDGKTSVYVMNTTRQVLVNGVLVPGGYKITLSDGAPLPMTPADLDQVNGLTAARSAANQSGDASAGGSLALAGGNHPVFNPNTFDQPELGKQLVGDSLRAGYAGPAIVAGALTPASLTGAAPGTFEMGAGSFSFSVDLGSGVISGAAMSNRHFASGDGYGYTLSGGSGAINGNNFAVSGFTGTSDINGDVHHAVTGSMSGIASSASSGLTVRGNYSVDFNRPDWAGVLEREQGAFTGRRQR